MLWLPVVFCPLEWVAEGSCMPTVQAVPQSQTSVAGNKEHRFSVQNGTLRQSSCKAVSPLCGTCRGFPFSQTTVLYPASSFSTIPLVLGLPLPSPVGNTATPTIASSASAGHLCAFSCWKCCLHLEFQVVEFQLALVLFLSSAQEMAW